MKVAKVIMFQQRTKVSSAFLVTGVFILISAVAQLGQCAPSSHTAIAGTNSNNSNNTLASSGNDNKCNAILKTLFENGPPSTSAFHNLVPKAPPPPLKDGISGSGGKQQQQMLRICDAEPAGNNYQQCCTAAVEMRLLDTSKYFIERQTRDSIGKLGAILSSRAQKFNDYFKELLAESKKEFHAMFKRTYGAIYEQNSYVFSDLFTELENYYLRGKVDLSDAMDQFFNTLYQKMFTVLNSQFTFDDKYLGCVSEHMKQLKPFGDVPDKLSVQIKRSFVATRTFAQSLASAAEVVRNSMNIKVSGECVMAVTKMKNCSLCSTGTLHRPCPNYCAGVMNGCLNNLVELDAEWNNFVASMEKVSERLIGPFNVVNVVEPINIKISEAIMNFQETNKDISGQVFQGCGRPMLGKRKRSIAMDDNDFLFTDATDAEELQVTSERVKRQSEYEPLEEVPPYAERQIGNSNRGPGGGGSKGNGKGNRGRNNKNKVDYEANKEPTLDKLIKDIRQKVKDTKKFWSNLPFQICNHDELTLTGGGPSQDCWNGQTVTKSNVESNTPANLIPNAPKRNAFLDAQLYSLRTSVNQLRNAYNGLDVEWSDQEETEFGSGAGSGSSGFDDTEDDDQITGSGMGDPYDYENAIGRTTGRINEGAVGGPTLVTTTINANLGITVDVMSSSSSTTIRPLTADTKNVNNENIDHRANNEDGGDSIGGVGGDGFNTIAGGGGGAGSGGVDKGTDTSGSNKPVGEMSIVRALCTYFFPIFMAWFGGIFSILL